MQLDVHGAFSVQENTCIENTRHGRIVLQTIAIRTELNLMGFIDKTLQIFVGSRNERQIRDLRKQVGKVNSLESQFTSLSNDELRKKTLEFRHRIEKGESVDSLLHEAYAAVREAARRTLGQRHYDVQIMGGIVLHTGGIAEMVTGEGKTLTATCPVYLNALAGRGVHVVTVNDYLARRDAQWMGNVFRMLGLSVGYITSDMDSRERRNMYNCDVTYGTNNEFGFDYLRDNMRGNPREQVQRGLHYALIDEVDSILVDEARTPLIISGPAMDYSELYQRADRVARDLEGIHDKALKEQLGEKVAGDKDAYRKALEEYDFEIKEKESQCLLTDRGIEKVEKMLGIGHLYDARNQGWPHMIEQALRAHHLFKLDKNYVRHEGDNGIEIVIVDEFTGRLQHGRRWSDGLHQAIEAKEAIRVREESVTYATVTLQNYFKLYSKLSGMTGTAMTEAGEFDTIYKLDVVAIPTNKALIRHDRDDLIYGSEGDKFQAVVAEVISNHLAGRPVLVGTTSVLKSERLSELLSKVSVRIDDGKLSIRTPVFRLPAPGSGRRASEANVEEVKFPPRVMSLDVLQVNGGDIKIRMMDPSVRLENPSANPRLETWFPVREELATKLASPEGFIGIKHNVLNAKLHAKEAEIVAQAGNLGAVTIATNMAGRGTDILLGGNGEFHTKQWLAQQEGITQESFLPEEWRGKDAYLLPRDVLIQCEKDYEAKVKATYEERFKADYETRKVKVIKNGGLAVIGTERHESRRIDNQLRGRCGRQGDPGSSQFFISLDDDLMRMFAGERIRGMMRGLGLRDGEAIQHRMITKSVERAQRKVEAHHFDMRKNLKEYDDVLDMQRKTIYKLRQSVVEGVDREQGSEIDVGIRSWLNDLLGVGESVDADAAAKVSAYMKDKWGVEWDAQVIAGNPRVVVRDNMILAAKMSRMPESIKRALKNRILNVLNRIVVDGTPGTDPAQWEYESIESELRHIYGLEVDVAELGAASASELEGRLEALILERLSEKWKELGQGDEDARVENYIVFTVRELLLQAVDKLWREHLRNMQQLRDGVHWEAQAQKDPKVVYKTEGKRVFEAMLDAVDNEVVRNFFHIRVEIPEEEIKPFQPREDSARVAIERARALKQAVDQRQADNAARSARSTSTSVAASATVVANAPGPNDVCWCGSGKKYKKCHMESDQAGLSAPPPAQS